MRRKNCARQVSQKRLVTQCRGQVDQRTKQSNTAGTNHTARTNNAERSVQQPRTSAKKNGQEKIIQQVV